MVEEKLGEEEPKQELPTEHTYAGVWLCLSSLALMMLFSWDLHMCWAHFALTPSPALHTPCLSPTSKCVFILGNEIM